MELRPCEWMERGITLHSGSWMPKSLSWSPSGRYIAIATHRHGVLLLDLPDYTTYRLPPDPRTCWLRPAWGIGDDLLYLCGRECVAELRRVGDGWREARVIPQPFTTRWTEHADRGGFVGIARRGANGFLRSDSSFNAMGPIRLSMRSGRRIWPIESEYPSWWEFGRSILISAYQGVVTALIVDIETGFATPWVCPDAERMTHHGTLHQCSRALRGPLIAGMLTSGPMVYDRPQADLAVVNTRTSTLTMIAPAPQWFADHPLALSPDGDRIAVIDEDFSLTIIPTHMECDGSTSP